MFDLMKIDDVAKNIHDCIMSAYSRSEYDIFKLGLSELNSLVDEVYEKHKLLARFFAGPIDSEITLVPPILERFQIIGIDVVENTYAFDTVTRTLGSIGVNAIEKNLPELAKLSSVQLSFLGYHVLGRRSSRPFERVIDSLDLVLSSAISGNALELAKSIGERIKMVGGEAINREATTRLLKSIAETFGDWGPEAYSEKSEEVRAEAWKLIIELFIFFSSIAAERGMFEASSFYVEKLFVLGSFARRKKLNEVIAENLKDSPSNGTLQRYRTQIIDKAEKEITKRKENLTYLQSFLSETKL